MPLYNIAGLLVDVDTFGKTQTQLSPYKADTAQQADITIDADWRRIKARYPHLSDEDCEYVATGGSFYRYLLDFFGFMLHSSAVVVDDKAYLITADSGTGKSTHTRLWLKLFGDRAYILNDDKPALRLEDGIWYAYGTPWSGKHDISVNKRIPVAGIACLERGILNSIVPISKGEAVYMLLRQCNRPKAAECRLKLLELLDQLISNVPIWKLTCNMEPDAAIVSYEGMSGKKWRD